MSTRTEQDGIYNKYAGKSIPASIVDLARKIGMELNVAYPATIKAHNALTATVDINVGFLPVKNNVAGKSRLLRNIPIAWLASNNAYIVINLSPGDTGYCICMDRALQPFTVTGLPVDPIQSAIHQMHDAVFIPMRLKSSNPKPIATTGITIDAADINLGAEATEYAVKYESLNQTIIAALNAGKGAAGSQAAAWEAALLAWQAAATSAKASKVKVQ